VNATVNVICSRIAAGASYAEGLAEAQEAGLAERDPSADVDGLDSVAKLMVLSALVFGVQLEVEEVGRRGLSSLGEAEIEAALARGWRIRELVELGPRISSGSRSTPWARLRSVGPAPVAPSPDRAFSAT
jgi:homoserine dehydrogenase